MSFPTRRTFLLGLAGTGALALAGCTGTGTTTNSTRVENDAPPGTATVANVEGTSGPLIGGTIVTVTGSNLHNTTGVTVGGSPVVALTATQDTVTFTTPNAAEYQPGAVPVVLTQTSGEPIDAGRVFEYQVITPVDKQMAYAFTYWQNYNLAEWGQLPDNDCGNYANQTLLARGWEQNEDWFSDYATTGDFSLSWVRGNEMDEYLQSRPEVTRLPFEARNQVKIGDIVMFDWDQENDNGVDHTMIVSAVIPQANGVNAIKLAGHTVDAQYRDFDDRITVEHPGGTAHFLSIA
ncbi:amidase domain-containing protein [Subtercola boreus]|uniref:amidase domain-containing protein n=1 Tax=Subtercola boreus TaxID=120213 RepID=UPI00116B0565|nr:amidase domain-containing protein [Subtercola boreus]TQL46938.1 IPT/TIG domain-containing protein [Subtercola boreus]